jgi:hypothetical protein
MAATNGALLSGLTIAGSTLTESLNNAITLSAAASGQAVILTVTVTVNNATIEEFDPEKTGDDQVFLPVAADGSIAVGDAAQSLTFSKTDGGIVIAFGGPGGGKVGGPGKIG